MDDDEPELDDDEDVALAEDVLEEDEDDSLLPEPEPELSEPPDPEDPEDPEEPFEDAGVDELEDDRLSVR